MIRPPVNKKLRISSFGISIFLHIVILSIFAVATFSRGKVSTNQYTTPHATITKLRKQLAKPQIIPKPKIKEKITKLRKQKLKELQNKKVEIASNKIDVNLAKDISKEKETRELKNEALSNIEFFGNQTSMRKVCFVVDCSGSMLGLFREVRNQLKSSISALTPDNFFDVIMFRGTGLIEIGDGELLRATPNNIKRALKRIDRCPRPFGSPNALEAIKRAISLKDSSGAHADVIYFLTDGFDFSSDENENFALEVNRLRLENSPKTRIHTIGFWTNNRDKEMLKRLAQTSGGEFTYFSGKAN